VKTKLGLLKERNPYRDPMTGCFSEGPPTRTRAQAQARYYNNRIESGRCASCSGQPMRRQTKCFDCREKARAYGRQRRAPTRSEGSGGG
jgi:hypothetical protein